MISIESVIKRAEETAGGQKDTNTEQLNLQIQLEQEKLVELIDKIESENLMNKLTPHRDALVELKKLEARFDSSIKMIDQYRSFESTLGVA